MIYVVHVRYRTNSGCNATDVRVEADNITAALEAATNKVSRRRGVIRIDSGHVTAEPARAAATD